MLDSLRLFAKSWPGKIMGGFLLVGIAGFGINNVITDLGSNTVARVGNKEINSREFLRAYQGQLNEVSRQIGTVPLPTDPIAQQIQGQVLLSLAQDAALDQVADNFGLGVSEDKLAQMLREDPSFQNALGTFDASSFSQTLQMSGLTEAEYFQMQGDAAKRQQLILSLFGDSQLPATASNLINRYSADQRTVEYFTLNETSIETPAAPTEEELAAYLAEHQAEYRTVETRTVQMLRLSTADLAATKTISDDAIAAEYERTKGSLGETERRTIQQVPLNAEQVTAFEAGQTAGTTFETLVADAGLTPTDLGTLPQSGITDRSLATAAFGLDQGAFTIIDGIGGKRAVHVSAIEGGGTPTLEEARDQISENLAMAEARTELAEVQDQIEELRAAFRPLTEIASRFNLDLYEANVTSGGQQLTVIPDLSTDDQPRIAQAIFKATEGALTPSIQLAGNGNLWFDLNAIEPARDQTLDEVRDTLTTAMTEERTNNAIMAAQAEAVSRMDAGESIVDVAASLNVFPQISSPFTRFGSEDGTIDAAVASAAFAGPAEHHGSAVSQTGEFVVFAVTDLTQAEGPLAQAANDSLENEARVGLYGDFITAVRDDAGLRVNQQALDQVLALNNGVVQ
nr:peptidylprolyl isomerase [uncultured Devosia sp.]